MADAKAVPIQLMGQCSMFLIPGMWCGQNEALLWVKPRVNCFAFSVECCSDLLDEEVSYFSPLFTGVLKRPAEVSGRQIHKCFNSYLLPFLQTGEAPPPPPPPISF